MAEGSTMEYLPEKPREPLASDCCGTGCSPCVMDIYQDELAQWEHLQGLSVEERKRFLERTSAGGTADTSHVALSPVEYRQFEIVNVVQVTRDSYLYTFKMSADQVLGLRPGQHAILRVQTDSGHYITRQYTPVSPCEQRGSFQVLIKIYSSGVVSQVVKNWSVGSLTDWKGPFGEFSYKENQFKTVSMLACGTGVAPMIQILQAVLSSEEDFTRLQLLFGCRTQHDILMKSKLDSLSGYWNFSVLYVLSECSAVDLQRDKGLTVYGDRVEFGRISDELLSVEIAPPSADHYILVCGTKSFDKDMINFLLKLGHERKQIFKFLSWCAMGVACN